MHHSKRVNVYSDLSRNMKATIFHNNEHTNIIISELDITPEKCEENHKHIYTTIIAQYLSCKRNNKLTNTTSYDIYSSEQTSPHHIHTKLAQLKVNKSSLLHSYLYTVSPEFTMFVTHTSH